MNAKRRIEIYDTTLRDGTQAQGVSLSLTDKLQIAKALDAIGVDYIEGGYPLSNPKDEAFFAQARDLKLANARLAAFGMTRRRSIAADQDTGMVALVNAAAPVITVVGKSWDLHVTDVLRATLDENTQMIAESVAHCVAAGREVIYDAEHFFDGYRANAEYALHRRCRAAVQGWRRLVPGAVRHQRRLAALAYVAQVVAKRSPRRCRRPSSASTATTTPNWPSPTASRPCRPGPEPRPGHHQRHRRAVRQR